jgi:LysB family phage lysis regulatory protein
MKAIALRVLAIALVVLAIVAGWFYVKALRAELVDAQNTARSAQETVGRRDATIADMQKKEREHTTASLAQTETDFEALKHENEALRAWADSPLPDDVVRLYSRPAITGADDWLAMRAGHALHAAGDGPAH